MNDSIQSAVIGAGLALLGVVIAGLLTILQSALSRRWTLEDARRSRRIEISDRRIDQAEAYLQAITADFRDLMHEIDYHALVEDLALSRARRDARNLRRDAIDLSIFAKGPALRSLDDDGLRIAYEGMIAAYEKISGLYTELGRRLELGQEVSPNHYREAAYHAWTELSTNLTAAYSRLDAVRMSRSE